MKTKRDRRGQILLLMTVMLTFMAMMAGMAVDFVWAYVVKARIASAVDAASLAASRALMVGETYSEQGAELVRIAHMVFDANFPPDLMLTKGTANLSEGPTVYARTLGPGATGQFVIDPSLPAGVKEIRIVGEVRVPTFFMRVFGEDDVLVRAGATAARRDTNVVLALDRSNSLINAGAWGAVQDAAKTFVDFFDNNSDQLGIVSFGSTGFVHLPPQTGFKTSNLHETTINGIAAGGATNSAMGLWLAYAELKNLADPSALNLIVFFTDGEPTAWQANFLTDDAGTVKCDGARHHATVATTFSSGNPRNIWHFYEPVGTGGVNIAGCQSYSSDTPQFQYAEWLYAPEPGTSTCIPSFWSPTWAGVTETFNFADGPYTTPDCSSWYWFSTSYSDSRGNASMDRARNQAVAVADAFQNDTSVGEGTIFSIGLGVAGLTANENFLKIIANDPSYLGSYGFDSTQAEGEYIFAPGTSELATAFEKVQSHVVRLTQ